jgi:hypothetical protein
MNPKELRIGNHVLLNGKPLEVRSIYSNDYFGKPVMQSEYKPIPITKEWLLEFGWKQCDSFTEAYHFNGFRFVLTENEQWIEYSDNEAIDIKYVHQLQNLYFALTGEELTINKDD